VNNSSTTFTRKEWDAIFKLYKDDLASKEKEILIEESLSLEESIILYEVMYKKLKGRFICLEEEKDVLLMVIYYRMKKIRRDYCE
jgi:hypothetical protein